MIGMIHNEPLPPGSPFSEASVDVLTQVEAFESALNDLGHRYVRIPFTRDIRCFLEAMTKNNVEMALNLCETVDEEATLSGHPAAVLELLGIPFSGSPSISLMLTTDKVTTKRLLRAGGIATPNYAVFSRAEPVFSFDLRYPVIVKPRFEDASIGIDQESVFESEKSLRKGIRGFSERFGDVLVEEYIGGRELNVSLLGFPSAQVLAVADIDFSGFPQDLYPIVGYRAKWDKSSFEYHHTPRRFPQDLSPFLLGAVKRTAVACFSLFMLRDYGRVDMRVDGEGKAHVLEVNANPCLSPDAGFAAAARHAGMTYGDMVGRLVSFMVQRGDKHARQIARSRR
jgi:D-alanine-D-alanine ligase